MKINQQTNKLTMKHLYKTKEGEILEADIINYIDNSVQFETNKGYEMEPLKIYSLSEVQEVVLDKDGKPFMFEGEVVCVGDLFRTLEIIGYYIHDDEVLLLIGTKGNTVCGYPESFDSNCTHTPKHPQKKGIEKIEIKAGDIYNGLDLEIALKVNELVEVVNKLKE